MTDQDPSQLYKRADQLHKLIVSLSYLVSKKALEPRGVKYGMIVASNAFGTCMIKAMSVALAEVNKVSILVC